MSLYFASLASGSNGNCYYVGNNEEAVLIDAGVNCKVIERRMGRLGLSMEIIKAVFITHEHTDHIAGVASLVKKYRMPVYITSATHKKSRMHLPRDLVFGFVPLNPVTFNNLQVTPFSKNHDAVEPHSFIVKSGNVTVGIFTDIGRICDQVMQHFMQCNAAFLEANYDETLLQEGKYPLYLKRRIAGEKGHLSNAQALELFLHHKTDQLSHLILSHLSKENNRPDLVEAMFRASAGTTHIAVASREKETAVFEIEIDSYSPAMRSRTAIEDLSATQLTLF